MYFLFLAYTPLDATPRPQSRCVATSCTGAAFALYNDTMAARMATLSRQGKSYRGGHCAALRWEIFLYIIFLYYIYFFPFLSLNTHFELKKKTSFQKTFPVFRLYVILFLHRPNNNIIIGGTKTPFFFSVAPQYCATTSNRQ